MKNTLAKHFDPQQPIHSNQISLFDILDNSQSTQPTNIISFPVRTQSEHTPHTHKHIQQRVSPIRDPEKVNQIFKSLMSSGKYGLRNATIFALQLAIGRRTNDILSMKISSVYNSTTKSVKSIITVDEHKTGKTARDLPLNQIIRNLLEKYIKTLKNQSPTALLFPSQKPNPDGTQRPLRTSTLDHIYKEYTSQVFLPEDDQTHISSYAARKTYGYNIYMECMKNNNGFLPGTDINALQYVQSVFNHENSNTTLRYIGAYDAPAMQLAENIAGQYDFGE